jgi:uncharacterized protein YidB (DUF937 family)
MGLFDSLARQALGGALGNPAEMLAGLLQEAGGLQGLQQRFQDAGYGELFASWVSVEGNTGVQPGQLQQALGEEALRQLAGRLGFQPQMLLPLLSQFLPQVIDKLTPNGVIDAEHPGPAQIQEALNAAMQGAIGAFFKRS